MKGRVNARPVFREHSAGERMQPPALKYIPEPSACRSDTRFLGPTRFAGYSDLRAARSAAEWKWYRGLRLPARSFFFETEE